MKIDLGKLSEKERFLLLKELIDSYDNVVVLATYGSSESISSSDLSLATEGDNFYHYKKGDLLIQTNIMTG